jgi:hypothetical protein
MQAILEICRNMVAKLHDPGKPITNKANLKVRTLYCLPRTMRRLPSTESIMHPHLPHLFPIRAPVQLEQVELCAEADQSNL